MVRLVDNTSTAVKTKDVVANAACPARLHLVFVPEELLACISTSIVEFGVCQNTK